MSASEKGWTNPLHKTELRVRKFRLAAVLPPKSSTHYDMMPDGRILGLVNPLEQGFQGSRQEIRASSTGSRS